MDLDLSNRLEVSRSEPAADLRVDGWLDARARSDRWQVHLRLRGAQYASGNSADSVGVDQRSLTFREGGIRVTGGTFYQTLGHGLIFRAREERSVAQGRSDRLLSLERDVDGVRVQAVRGPVEFLAFSGRPRLTPPSGQSAGKDAGQRVDVVQAVSADYQPAGPLLSFGFSILGAERRVLARPGQTVPDQTLRSVRGGSRVGDLAVRAEWVDMRWTPGGIGSLDGRALYGEMSFSVLGWGASLEYKNYNHYFFSYAEPPTLFRTHDSILLNASTPVLKPTEEGFQFEGLRSFEDGSSLTANLTGAWSEVLGRRFRYREVFVEHRGDHSEWSWHLFGDLAEDTARGDDSRWTGGGGIERTLGEARAWFIDLEAQAVRPEGDSSFTNGLAQAGVSESAGWTVSIRWQWTSRTNSFGERSGWLSGTIGADIADGHSLFLFAGARPAGLVCSGGFCFLAPEFEGVEARLLSVF